MGLTIELSKEKEEILTRRAAAKGLAPTQFVEQLLERELADSLPEAESIKTGADLVAYWDRLGLFGSRPDIGDSVEHARAVRRKAERRHRADS